MPLTKLLPTKAGGIAAPQIAVVVSAYFKRVPVRLSGRRVVEIRLVRLLGSRPIRLVAEVGKPYGRYGKSRGTGNGQIHVLPDATVRPQIPKIDLTGYNLGYRLIR